MKQFIGVVALLMLISYMAMPTLAAELRMRGFFENVLPHVDHNTSDADLDMTRTTDQIFFGRARTRLFFDFIANDDLRGVLALEVDSTYGAPRYNRVGARCPPGIDPYTFEQCGFRNGIDTNNIEVKPQVSPTDLKSKIENALVRIAELDARRITVEVDGGTVRPSAPAVLRLIASSNFVGCCTGRSAGLSPLSIRPA